MSAQAKKPRRPADLNRLAAAIVGAATSEEEEAQAAETPKDPAAVALGRKGGLKGGKARAANLTPERRREIAKKAAAARWRKDAASTAETT